MQPQRRRIDRFGVYVAAVVAGRNDEQHMGPQAGGLGERPPGAGIVAAHGQGDDERPVGVGVGDDVGHAPHGRARIPVGKEAHIGRLADQDARHPGTVTDGKERRAPGVGVEGTVVHVPVVVSQRPAGGVARQPRGQGRDRVVDAAVDMGHGHAAGIGAGRDGRVQGFASPGVFQVRAEKDQLGCLSPAVVEDSPAAGDPAVAAGRCRHHGARCAAARGLVDVGAGPAQPAAGKEKAHAKLIARGQAEQAPETPRTAAEVENALLHQGRLAEAPAGVTGTHVRRVAGGGERMAQNARRVDGPVRRRPHGAGGVAEQQKAQEKEDSAHTTRKDRPRAGGCQPRPRIPGAPVMKSRRPRSGGVRGPPCRGKPTPWRLVLSYKFAPGALRSDT